MNSVTCHASRSRHRLRTASSGPAAGGRAGRACGAQSSVATSAGTAQTASAPGHPAPMACWSGTVSPAPLAAPPHTAIV